MRDILLDGRRMQDRAQAHDYLATMLALPDYYGRNLDALHDCLTEIGAPTRIMIVHPGALEELMGSYGAVLLRVLETAAEENPQLVVELVGEGR